MPLCSEINLGGGVLIVYLVENNSVWRGAVRALRMKFKFWWGDSGDVGKLT